MGMMKIVSLLPSATEILFALGLDDQIVAVTHECDFPPQALEKPRITRSLLRPDMTSGTIDAEVRAQLTADAHIRELFIRNNRGGRIDLK